MIPLATLYYLLCYAWQRRPEPAVLQASAATPFHRPLELLTQMLLHASRQLLRAGLPLSFINNQQVTSELRGRIELAPTLGRGLLPQGRALCSFDELSPNRPLHQLLAGTLAALAPHPGLAPTLRREVGHLRRRLPAGVQPIVPTAGVFAELRRQRLAAAEAFLLHICELIYQTSLPVPTEGSRGRFTDFRRDEALMARIFEQAVRNFYRLEQHQYRVFTETITWRAEAAQPEQLALLPTMLTDTTLENPTRKIILDTKYYAAALRLRYDQPRLIAPHLYQLYAYLQNVQTSSGQALEGILLYPAATAAIDVRYTLGGHPVRIVTLDLHQAWPGIAADLLALLT